MPSKLAKVCRDGHGFLRNLICIEQPLDDSARAQKRSPCWQKCLILGEESVNKYDRVVWVDADVLMRLLQMLPVLSKVWLLIK